MSRLGNSAIQSGGSGASRMVSRLVPESSSRLHLEEFPLGDETGLPLILCPQCGLARVIERRSGKESTKNYLRVFFKCPRNGYPKLCGFYKFQREYLEELKKAGIISMRTSFALEIADEVAEGADATSGNEDMKVEAKKDAANETKLHTKMDDLMWKFNLLMFVFAVFIGAVMMYLAVGAK